MPENQNIEYKQSWHDDYLKWIGGFANAQGGKIYIGKDDSGEVETLEYPVAALREIILNALIHRNYMGVPTLIRVYDNKLSVWSHGTLPEGMTLNKLTQVHSSYPRNPIIAGACFLGGYIDSWGSGIMKIVSSCKMAGLPTPVIEEDGGGVMIQLFKDKVEKEELPLNERQIRAVQYVKENGKITNGEYQRINNISRNTASTELNNLVDKSIFKNSDIKGAGSYYQLNN